jgi:hypothetical protein
VDIQRVSIAPGDFAFRHDSPLAATVVYTGEAGTLAALKVADDIARRLGSRTVLGIPAIVPPQYALENPLLPIDLFEQRALRAISASGIREDAVSVQIWLCRDRKKCLQQILRPHSLIVIGGRWHWWWRDEWKLEKWLCGHGHRVIFADVRAGNCVEMLPKSHRESVFTHTVSTRNKKSITG